MPPSTLVLYPWSGNQSYDKLCIIATCLIFVTLATELATPTAYGKFGNLSSGSNGISSIRLDARLGWFLMELPCSTWFIYQFYMVGGPQSHQSVPKFFGFLFTCHYIYRGYIFPFFLSVHHENEKNFDLGVAFGSWLVTVIHAHLNARWYAEYGKHLVAINVDKKRRGGKRYKWTCTWRFRIGLVLYYLGLASVIYHDHIMRTLRPCPNNARYCIPHAGLFQYVSAANYLSELIMWAGFAMASWGPNGAFIFLISVANLIPRSASTHQWYLEHFPGEYELLGRVRLFPGIW
uniref:3-oxo-5-alpha-steroid 4-dehydrogenase C-terminal domain-containing protein n=2 Tax=Ditylum brightwellii TaxID=49249 RepID=A0A6U3TPW4_9STRA|mmetsp:Transcript_3304/g.4999  ORF Transcript_3304/g.4999 Transcript_3304/m.4999 type:complete len:291 (+) Transcript_3304:41-913(+)